MRSLHEVEQYGSALLQRYESREDEDPRVPYQVACYDASIPKLFWGVQADMVKRNVEVFNEVVIPYRQKSRIALRRGYSLLFLGDNGSGKTMFISYLLTQAIKRGESAYYTTLAQLDIDIKRGFKDKEAEDRLHSLLQSDFVGIDEVGKESFKPDSFVTMRFELLLKQRHDDEEPVLMGSNIDFTDLCKMYGSSVESMLDGRYRTVTLEPGDYRKKMKSKMKLEMGYD